MDESPYAFGQLIQDYMWTKRRPPISMTRFAREAGVNQQTVWNWINAGARPSLKLIVQVHQRMGIPLPDLLRAGDYPADLADVLPDQIGSTARTVADCVDILLALYQEDAELPTAERERAVLVLREARARYAVNGRGHRRIADHADAYQADTTS